MNTRSALHRLPHLVLGLGITLLVPLQLVPAQELKNVLPQTPPKLVGTNAPALSQPAEITHTGAQPGEKVVIPKLKGVHFVAAPDQVRTNGVSTLGVDASAVPLLRAPDFPLTMNLFLGQPASLESLHRITIAVRTYLNVTGYPFVTVLLPPQDITGGSVQVVVQPALMPEQVPVEGAKYFSESQYRAALTQRTGEPINADTLKEDIDWLNRNPFRNVNVVAEPGAQPGTTALKLRATERFPARFYAGYNNTGSRVSDEDRVVEGFNWGNAFGLGHQMSYQFTGSDDFKTSVAHSGSYAVDLPWRHTVRLIGAYSELVGRVAAPLTLNGRSWQVGLRYDIPLPKPSPNVTHSLSLGLDFKESDNNLLFATIPVTDNLTHVAQLALSYDLGITDKWGRTDFGLNAFLSPGGLTSRNGPQFYTISRAGSHPDYAYAQLSVSRQTPLPLGLNWSARGQFQKSTANLLGSERGYEEGEVYGDNGVLLSHELALPAVSLAEWFDFKQLGDSLQFFGFQDFALLWSADRLAGGRRYTDLHSAGVGCRYNVRQNLSVNCTHGWQLRESHVSRSGEGTRTHLSVQASF